MKAKKILAIAMAMVMTFVVFAIPSSAVTGYFLKPIVGVDGGKTTVAAGETVKITFALETEQEYNKWNGGLFSLAWDNTKIDYAGTMEYTGKWATVMDTTQTPNTAASALTNVTWSAADIAKGYNDGMKMVLAESTQDYALTDGEVLLTYDFKVADDVAPGTKIYVGIADGQYAGNPPAFYLSPDSEWGFPIIDEESEWNMSDYGMGSYDKSASYVELTVGSADPEVVALDDTMARMDDWTKAESTDKFDGGLIGQINNLKLTFTDGDCDQIDTIEVYANGKKMGNAYQVYKVDDTTYQFRAVIKNMDKTAETYADDIEYEFKVTLKGDYAGQTLTATKTVSAQAIYAEAYAAYQTANA